MPTCCVTGCNNSTAKGFSMRCFPTDPERRALWIANIGKPNWEPNSNSRICEVHFSKDMWEKVRCDGKQKLKCNAMPTIFPTRQPDKNISNNHNGNENNFNSDNLVNDKSNILYLLPIVQTYSNISTSNISTNMEKDVDWKKQCEELRHLLRKSEQTCKYLQTTLKRREEMFNRIIVKSNRHRRILKERVKRFKAINQNYEKLKSSLEQVINKGQIIVLNGHDHKWSYETIMQLLIQNKHVTLTT